MRLVNHIYSHPYRLSVTIASILLISWGFAGYALWHSLSIAHNSRVENCRAIQELSKELRLAAVDIGFPVIGERFQIDRNCEELP